MKTTLTARHIHLTDALRGQIERRLRRIERVVHPEAEASIELIGGASHAADEANVAEVTLVSRGTVVRSTAPGATPIAAVDAVIDKLERRVVRSKQRPRRVRERAAGELDAALIRASTGALGGEEELGDGSADGAAAAGRPAVVKTKRFDLAPMFEEDAITQMDELGHAFFVFLNAETDRVAVVYRRRDGGYGLIDPVVGPGGGAR